MIVAYHKKFTKRLAKLSPKIQLLFRHNALFWDIDSLNSFDLSTMLEFKRIA